MAIRDKKLNHRGTSMQFSLDEATRSRIAWCGAVTQHVFGEPANKATVVRRALDAYVSHLESIMAKDSESLPHYAERCRLRAVRKGEKLPIPVEDACALPIEPLSARLKRHREAQRAPKGQLKSLAELMPRHHYNPDDEGREEDAS